MNAGWNLIPGPGPDDPQAVNQGKHRVGLTRIELVTSALSVLRSNQLSYSPANRFLTLHHGGPGADVGVTANSGPDGARRIQE